MKIKLGYQIQVPLISKASDCQVKETLHMLFGLLLCCYIARRRGVHSNVRKEVDSTLQPLSDPLGADMPAGHSTGSMRMRQRKKDSMLLA